MHCAFINVYFACNRQCIGMATLQYSHMASTKKLIFILFKFMPEPEVSNDDLNDILNPGDRRRSPFGGGGGVGGSRSRSRSRNNSFRGRERSYSPARRSRSRGRRFSRSRSRSRSGSADGYRLHIGGKNMIQFSSNVN